MAGVDLFSEKNCKGCGKYFVVARPAYYTYKLQIKDKLNYYCSYTCWRKAGGDAKPKGKKYQRYNQ